MSDTGDDDHLSMIARANRPATKASQQTNEQRVDLAVPVDNRGTALTNGMLVVMGVCILTAAIAAGFAINASWSASIAERESRLAQEDLMLLRAAVKAHGINAESSHDHEDE